MLDSIWTLLGNYGLDLQEIAGAIHSLFNNEDGVYSGSLAALGSFPMIGIILQLFASFAPTVETTLN